MHTTSGHFMDEQCLASARRGVAWLLDQQKPDGSWKGLQQPAIESFYKASPAFGLMGERIAANRCLDYVQKHFLQSDGDFLPRELFWLIDVHYLYGNAYIIIGAHHAARYAISTPATAFMLSQRHPEHRGFYSMKMPLGETGRSDTMSTGLCGLACLATGQLEAARQAAECLWWMIESQPAPGQRFYTTIEPNMTLGADFPEEERFWRLVDAGQPEQCWYALGLPFLFALQLYDATGDERHHDLMQWFFEFQSRCTGIWNGLSSAKAAWGCAQLYRMTGESKYREIAVHVAGQLMAMQAPNGGWFLDVKEGDELIVTPASYRVIEYTAQFIMWLGLIGFNLRARDG